MYYPIKWHRVLKLDTLNNTERSSIISVQANQERDLFLILTSRSLHLWNSRPVVEIVAHKRSEESVESLGYNKSAVWKTDSNVIVVATEGNQLLFFHVSRRSSTASSLLFSSSSDSDSIYNLRWDSKCIDKITQHDQELKRLIERHQKSQYENIPSLTVHSFGKLDLSQTGISCMMSAEEELVIGAKSGDILGVLWNGNIDKKFPWTLARDIPNSEDYVIDIKFSSVLSGFAMVFESGRIGFLSSKTVARDSPLNASPPATRDDETSRLKFLPTTEKASCVDMNHRYRLVAVGFHNSEVLVCNVNDMTSCLVVNHNLKLQDNKFPYDLSKLGSVQCIRYSPDGVGLLTSWDSGEFAIWSVFGSLLFCTLQWKLDSSLNYTIKLNKISSVAWSQEGYNIWMSVVKDDSNCTKQENNHTSTNGSLTCSMDENDIKSTTSSQSEGYASEEVIIVPLAHSNLPASPHLTCSSDCIILMSEDSLHIGPSVPHKAEFDNWFVIDIPQHYLNSNYPIRYATVDRHCKNIVIAGNRGLALYSIDQCQWKFLTKASYATSFSVCGDIIWWNNYIIASTYSLVNETFEIRAYLTTDSLSNDTFIVQSTPQEVIRMSIFENRLLVLYSDGTLGMFMLNLRHKPNIKTANKTSLQIAPIENLVISNLQANAYCIASIALTRLHFKNNRTDDSIILNACGKLFLLEREAPPSLSTPSPTNEISNAELRDLSLDSDRSSEIELKVKEAKRLSDSVHLSSASIKNKTEEPGALINVTFKAVSVIATNVEQFWISPEISSASDMCFFKKSLWLSCGGSNNHLQVWLPLLNDKDDPPMDLYVPDRIMLPIKCDIYPLAIRSSSLNEVEPDDAIVLGAENEILYSDIKLPSYFPYSAMKRQCRIYLHRILRELLLNQHLGYYARKIAESCQSLPYFAHCFELLLHEVLEEEATSPVPLPDPMLPQIVRFIKEFPVYLETVVHCARKSELFMWSHLFDERAAGNPRRLFQECLEKNKLDTAASCLIILQSLDRNIVTQRMIRQLIQMAKEDEKFSHLVPDLENFLTRVELDLTSTQDPIQN